MLQTQMIFRRRKPKVPLRLLTALGALVLLPVTFGIVVGIRGSGTSEPTGSSTEAATLPSEPEASKSGEPGADSASVAAEPSQSPPPRATDSAGPGTCTRATCYQTEFRFGETAPFVATAGWGPDIPLAVTVSAPTRFTPSNKAAATQAETVYVAVTIKNYSDTETWDPFLQSNAVSLGTDGDEIYSDGMGTGGLPDVLPGQSITFKDGWSVASANDVTYELDRVAIPGRHLWLASGGCAR